MKPENTPVVNGASRTAPREDEKTRAKKQAAIERWQLRRSDSKIATTRWFG